MEEYIKELEKNNDRILEFSARLKELTIRNEEILKMAKNQSKQD